jgi:hypothetical protein
LISYAPETRCIAHAMRAFSENYGDGLVHGVQIG